MKAYGAADSTRRTADQTDYAIWWMEFAEGCATRRKNTEQDWLKTNVARFTRLLQGQRDLLTVSRLILSELAPLVRCSTVSSTSTTRRTASPA